MNRISDRLQHLRQRKEKALALFLTAGYPTLDATANLVWALEKAGADIIELGMPFSDPLADGPVIQQTSATALKNGVTLGSILEDVMTIRRNSEVPVVLMGYVNPILRFGAEKFFRAAADAGVDGVILPEVPLEESGRFSAMVSASKLAYVHLVTPTSSPDRIRRIDEVSSGFLYCVSTTGVTGIRASGVSEEYLQRVKQLARKNPVLVGFGVHSEEDAKQYSRAADGVIVGSALLARLSQQQSLESICAWVSSMRRAMT